MKLELRTMAWCYNDCLHHRKKLSLRHRQLLKLIDTPSNPLLLPQHLNQDTELWQLNLNDQELLK